MSEEANKKLVRELFAAIDAHDKDAMFALLHEDYSMNLTGGGEPRDKEQHWLFASAMKAAFGDMVHRPDIQVAEGDLVFSQGTTWGHHTGVINGKEPTGRAFEGSARANQVVSAPKSSWAWSTMKPRTESVSTSAAWILWPTSTSVRRAWAGAVAAPPSASASAVAVARAPAPRCAALGCGPSTSAAPTRAALTTTGAIHPAATRRTSATSGRSAARTDSARRQQSERQPCVARQPRSRLG